MISIITPDILGHNLNLVADMFRLRRRVFADTLNWDVTTVGDFEIDKYDAYSPTYLIVQNDAGKVCGCVRLLPSTGPTMLEGVFPALITPGLYKSSDSVWESSRFAVDTEMGGRENARLISPYTLELFAGMIEYGLMKGWSHVVTVTDLRLERVLGIARWPLHRIGEAREIGATTAVAGLVEISQAMLDNVQKTARNTSSVLAKSANLQFTGNLRSRANTAELQAVGA